MQCVKVFIHHFSKEKDLHYILKLVKLINIINFQQPSVVMFSLNYLLN